MADAGEVGLFHLVHTWANTGALALLVALGKWMGGRLVKQLDEKADKETVETLRVQVNGKADSLTVAEVRSDVERRHRENLDMLREIKSAIERNDTEATQVRNTLQTTMTSLVGQVAKIEGWIAGTMQATTPGGKG